MADLELLFDMVAQIRMALLLSDGGARRYSTHPRTEDLMLYMILSRLSACVPLWWGLVSEAVVSDA